jgi:hypothetical protein
MEGLIHGVACSSLFVENLLDILPATARTVTMGLNASVRCNCIKEGKAPLHPFPELLAFDETGEPTLKGHGNIESDSWLKHDKWYRDSCPRSGCLVDKRLGNIAAVAYIRGFLEDNSPNDFPLFLERVVYDGTLD